MFFHRQRQEKTPSVHYTGRDCYTYVDKLIISSRELMIVSPYVDAYYADFLIGKSGGKNVMLLSSSMEKSAHKLFDKGPHTLVFWSITAILLLLDLSELYLGALTIAVAAASLFLAAASALLLLRRKNGIKIKRPKEFVHVKLYISESQAIQGSANLTYNGMHKNVEHIEVINDPEVIKLLRKDFMNLWRNTI